MNASLNVNGSTLVLPYPPSVNRYWRMARGRMILSDEAHTYKEQVWWQSPRNPVDGPVSLVIRVFRPQKRGDLDNTLKALLDALQGVLYHDDKQIIHIEAFRFDDKENPRVEVTVHCVDEWDDAA